MDATNCTLTNYQCFEEYFLYVNKRNRKLIGSDSDFSVVDIDLVGMDVLWRVALEARRSDVYKKAISFLNQIHDKLSASLKGIYL
jgi:hypothetical protein